MSGFVGYVNKSGVDNKIIKKMADIIKHRGPNGEDYYTDDNAALGFCRLNNNGFACADNLIVMCDGETDAELILRGYLEHGEQIAERLTGTFAFIIYDKITGDIYGARDCFGVKPFYYYPADNIFMFGSEIKSFLQHPDFKKELNAQALKMYLVFQYSALEETFFKNVFRLNQGCYFTYKNNKIKVTRYFEPEYKTQDKSFDEYIKIISEALENSVNLNKRGDLEIGGLLSGGVDSSYIATLAKPDKSFSVGFDKDGFDESMYARELCDILNIKNYKKIISADEFFAALPKVQYYSDEPHANLSSVPLYYLAEMAAEQVKIVLSGEGADEFFAGYLPYADSRPAKIYKILPFGLRKIIKNIAQPLPNFKGRATLIKYGRRVEDYYIGQAFIMDDGEANNILAAKYKNNMSYKDITGPYFNQVKDKSDLVKKLYLDLFLWMPNDILLKADRMTAAHGLEARMPILNKEMFGISSSIPAEYLIKNKVTKYIFREAASKIIPDAWAKREKLGFPVPFRLWLREQKYYDILKDMFNEDFTGEFFERDKILDLLEAHYKGAKNNGRRLYTVYSFLLWYKIYFINDGGII